MHLMIRTMKSCVGFFQRGLKMRILKYVGVAVVGFSLTACVQDMGTKQMVGTLGGGVLGGIAGSQFGGGNGRLIATGAGALLGAWAGGEVGKSLDRADRMYMERASTRALETAPAGQAVTWSNPDSGHYGAVIPQRAYEANGTYCREYTQTVNVGGRSERAYGTACRQPDGEWRIQNG